MTKQKILIIFAVFLILRLILIFTFPLFIDEGIYILYGRIMTTEPGQLFASISMWHKQPLAFWIFGTGSFLTPDPVIGARLIQLLLNSLSFPALYLILKNFKDQRVTLTGLLLLTLCPLFIFFQSLALFEGLLLTCSLFIFLILQRIAKKFKSLDFFLLGLILALILWIKITALFVIILTLAYLIFLVKTTKKRFSKPLGLLITIATFICLSIPLITAKESSLIFSEAQAFSFTIPELFQFPVGTWFSNLLVFFYDLLIYLTPGVFLVSFFSYKLIKDKRYGFYYFWFLSLSLVLIFITRNDNSSLSFRYFLPGIAGLLIISSLSLANLPFKKYSKLIYGSIFGTLILGSLTLIFFPIQYFSVFPKNPIFQTERDYVFGWASGFQAKVAVDYISQIPEKPILILFPGGSPDLPMVPLTTYGLIYFHDNPNVRASLFAYSKESLAAVDGISKQFSLVIFATHSDFAPKELLPHLKLLKTFPKPGGDSLNLYQFN